MKIPKLDPRSQIGVNMVFIKIYSTQVELVLNLLTCSISPRYHVVFDDMFYTVMNNTVSDLEVWIKLFISRNSRIEVMIEQEDDPELDDECLTSDDRLTRLENLERKL